MANTYKKLYDRVASFENLYLAAKKAQKSKRFKDNTAKFNYFFESEIILLHEELLSGEYQTGGYIKFLVFEPKRRAISAAPYRDRVVHHALCNVIEPLFENSFIYDTYANRLGKGTHKALTRAQIFCRQYKYVLKCDIEKYFDSIDREILIDIIQNKIKDTKVMGLVNKIVYSGKNGFDIKKGLPLGNLTSQFFANLYLNGFDHYVKEKLKVKGYVRYVDDFILFDNEKTILWEKKCQMEEYLNKLKLKLHKIKTRLIPITEGVDFLGFKIFPERSLLNKDNYFRFRRKIKKMCMEYHTDKQLLKLEKISASVRSWTAHTMWGDTENLRIKLFKEVGL